MADGTEVVFVEGIERGMIFWASVKGAEAKGSEQHHEDPSPWLIVSNDRLHKRLPIVQAAPLTTKLHQEEKFRNSRIRLQADQLTVLPQTARPAQPTLSGDSIVLSEQTRVMSHGRLIGEPVAKLTTKAMLVVEGALAYVFDIKV